MCNWPELGRNLPPGSACRGERNASLGYAVTVCASVSADREGGGASLGSAAILGASVSAYRGTELHAPLPPSYLCRCLPCLPFPL